MHGKNEFQRQGWIWWLLGGGPHYTAYFKHEGMRNGEVVTGHWGCRAFGGNREIKSIIQWCAASMARVELNFVCDKGDSFASDFQNFTARALNKRWTVHAVLAILRGMGPSDESARSGFDHMRCILDGG
ncbi:hypothetical protein C8R44DRAFT_724889 [Mycena epipterygia]|nr:hypothetical protein C8R44DRAFT_724889 [Mycena epipterygia]